MDYKKFTHYFLTIFMSITFLVGTFSVVCAAEPSTSQYRLIRNGIVVRNNIKAVYSQNRFMFSAKDLGYNVSHNDISFMVSAGDKNRSFDKLFSNDNYIYLDSLNKNDKKDWVTSTSYGDGTVKRTPSNFEFGFYHIAIKIPYKLTLTNENDCMIPIDLINLLEADKLILEEDFFLLAKRNESPEYLVLEKMELNGVTFDNNSKTLSIGLDNLVTEIPSTVNKPKGITLVRRGWEVQTVWGKPYYKDGTVWFSSNDLGYKLSQATAYFEKIDPSKPWEYENPNPNPKIFGDSTVNNSKPIVGYSITSYDETNNDVLFIDKGNVLYNQEPIHEYPLAPVKETKLPGALIVMPYPYQGTSYTWHHCMVPLEIIKMLEKDEVVWNADTQTLSIGVKDKIISGYPDGAIIKQEKDYLAGEIKLLDGRSIYMGESKSSIESKIGKADTMETTHIWGDTFSEDKDNSATYYRYKDLQINLTYSREARLVHVHIKNPDIIYNGHFVGEKIKTDTEFGGSSKYKLKDGEKWFKGSGANYWPYVYTNTLSKVNDTEYYLSYVLGYSERLIPIRKDTSWDYSNPPEDIDGIGIGLETERWESRYLTEKER